MIIPSHEQFKQELEWTLTQPETDEKRPETERLEHIYSCQQS